MAPSSKDLVTQKERTYVYLLSVQTYQWETRLLIQEELWPADQRKRTPIEDQDTDDVDHLLMALKPKYKMSVDIEAK